MKVFQAGFLLATVLIFNKTAAQENCKQFYIEMDGIVDHIENQSCEFNCEVALGTNIIPNIYLGLNMWDCYLRVRGPFCVFLNRAVASDGLAEARFSDTTIEDLLHQYTEPATAAWNIGEGNSEYDRPFSFARVIGLKRKKPVKVRDYVSVHQEAQPRCICSFIVQYTQVREGPALILPQGSCTDEHFTNAHKIGNGWTAVRLRDGASSSSTVVSTMIPELSNADLTSFSCVDPEYLLSPTFQCRWQTYSVKVPLNTMLHGHASAQRRLDENNFL